MAFIDESEPGNWRELEQNNVKQVVGPYIEAINELDPVYTVMGWGFYKEYDWQNFNPALGHKVRMRLTYRG